MTTRFTWTVTPGTPVRVYRNLHAACWSVQVRLKLPGTRSHVWRVAGHADALVLDRATFRVSEKGRQRVLTTGTKNVHAYVLGTLVNFSEHGGAPFKAHEVSYNPRRQSLFSYYAPVTGNVTPLRGASRVWLSPTGKVHAEL